MSRCQKCAYVTSVEKCESLQPSAWCFFLLWRKMVAFTSDCVYLFLYFGSGFFLLNCRKIILWFFFFAYFFFEFGCFPLVCFSRTCFSFLFWIRFFFLIAYCIFFSLYLRQFEKWKVQKVCFWLLHAHPFFIFYIVKRI